jgi:pimeloyl-ACP methyl ester carboxylesterase
MLAHSGAFAGVTARLGDALATVSMDLPGHGATQHDPQLGMQAQAAANAVALLEDMGPSHLIGHSFGATVALRVALERPDLVRRLALIEPVMFGFLEDAGDPAYAAWRIANDRHAAALNRGDRAAAADAFVGAWGAGGPTPYAVARMPLVAAAEADLAGLAPGRLRLSDSDALAAPVLLVEGARSPPAVAAIHDAIAARLPGVRRVVVPDAGHMAPVTHPQAVSGALRDFLLG